MKRASGFTLIELMIVVAIIAILASTALPNLLSARVSSNESAAIATMKHVVSAESVMQALGAIDQDNDGTGEYGWLGEMAGTASLRTSAGPGGGPLLNPPSLAKSLGLVNANGVATKSGYIFRMSLPDAAGAALGEAAGGGAVGGESADLCEQVWICYGWPAGYASSGKRAFCVNQGGDLLQTNNVGGATGSYDGMTTPPSADAAFEQGAIGTITGSLSIKGAPAPAVDGKTWIVVN